MSNDLRELASDERGATLVEYSLVVMLIAAVAIGAANVAAGSGAVEVGSVPAGARAIARRRRPMLL